MDDTRCILRQRLTVAAALLIATSLCFGRDKIKVDIPADVLPKAALEYYRQTHVEILFLSTPDLYRIRTRAVRGEFDSREILRRLLAGTGLIYEFDTDHAVIIKKPNDETVYFDIPAGAASDRLNEWSFQARAQLLFDFNVVKGLKTREVKGLMSRIEALLRLISGLLLEVSEVGENAYAVQKRALEDPDSPRFAESNRRNRKAIQGMDEVLIASNRGVGISSALDDPRLIIYDRTDIEASAVTTVQDFAGTIPQVWGGGPNEYSQIGREGQTNPNSATGFNYRSLGAASTLVMVDGIRPAKSGTEAGWWDISLLPLSAVERIEIGPEQAANRYGMDAISGVVNFVTRSDFKGIQTQAEVGGTTSGGGGERRVSQLLGGHWGSVDASLILDYYDRDVIPAAQRAQATSDLRRWGGTNWNSPTGYPGTLMTATGQTWAITGVSNGRPLLGAEGSSNTYDYWQSRDILPWQQRVSVLGHASLLVGDARIWSSAWLSERHATGLLGVTVGTMLVLPPTNPGFVNPLGGNDPVYLEYGASHLLGPATYNSSALSGNVAAGLTLEKQNWSFDFSAQTGLERDRLLLGGYENDAALQQALLSTDPGSVINPFSEASSVDPSVLAGISQIYYYQSYSRLQSADVSVGRKLTSPAGEGLLSLGAEYRQESLSTFNPSLPPEAAWQNAERGVSSIYADLELPLIGKSQAVPGVASLKLFVGGRREHYSDGEAMTSPSISLAWSPIPTLTLTGTFRRAFRPPALTENNTSGNFSETVPLPDGRTALVEIGGNPNLQAERARISTGGVDFRPTREVLLSATYYSVVSSGRVFQPLFSTDLNNFNGRVVAEPTGAQIAAICAESRFVGGTTESCQRTPVDLFLDVRLQSLEALISSGTELAAQVLLNHWKFRFDGTYLLSFRGTGLNGTVLEELNTLNNPVHLRARATAARELGPVTLSVSAGITGSYRDTLSEPQRRIGSWTTVDLAASYKPVQFAGLKGAEAFLRVRNLMNRQPPFANDEDFTAGWDPENGGNLAGRVVSGEIRWTW